MHSEDHRAHSTRSGKQSEIARSSHPEGVRAVNPRRLEFVDSRNLTFFDKKTVITTFGKHWNCYCGNKHLVCVLYFLMRMGGRCSLVRWGFVALCRILGSRTRSRTRWCGSHQMVRVAPDGAGLGPDALVYGQHGCLVAWLQEFYLYSGDRSSILNPV